MASAYKCDRCGNYYQQIGYLPPNYCVCRSNGLKAGVKLDLCPDCGKVLEDWMDGKETLNEVDDE